jgi:hypothetical protein
VEYIWTGEWGKKVREILEQKTSINSETGCWEWLGAHTNGYGQIIIDQVVHKVHRLSAMMFLGYDPEFTYLQVLHRCNNKRCWNYEHLYIGTDYDNAQDRVKAGTSINQNTDKTYCIHGHEFTPENTREYVNSRDGKVQRECRECRKVWTRISNEKRRLRKLGKVG